jgi:hypothetical protein
MTQIPDWLDHVGPGWHPLLQQLHTDIAALDPGYKVAQVKEKFGGLRVYLTAYRHPDINTLIHAAEAQSQETCEGCGAPGRIRNRVNRVWLQCLCDVCVEKEPERESKHV